MIRAAKVIINIWPEKKPGWHILLITVRVLLLPGISNYKEGRSSLLDYQEAGWGEKPQNHNDYSLKAKVTSRHVVIKTCKYANMLISACMYNRCTLTL